MYIEHAFGLLKNRFPCLKAMGRHNDMKDVHRVVQALMVIHNLCIDWEDAPTDPRAETFEGADGEGNNGQEEDEDVDCTGDNGLERTENGDIRIPPYESDEWQKEEGRKMCIEIMDRLFPL